MLNIYVNIAAGLLFLSIKLIGSTLRFNRGWKEALIQASSQGNVLFAVWHQATFAMFYLYRRSKAVVLVSEEPRGQILAKCARWLGYQPITVTDLKRHLDYARNLHQMLKLIEQGNNAVIVVDGPSGPLFEVKPGVYYLAAKANVPIVPMGIVTSSKLTLFWRWDKYFIPLPFARVWLKVGQAILPAEHTKIDLGQKLKELSQ